ncbi:MAG: hypothetical protein PWP11_849 [Thauera sp.]|nr:hypothetical protein [Thauera sp.]MDI3489572.1 hypothetical protein [Thauera sp.]
MTANCIDAACEAVCAEPQYMVLRTPTLGWRPYAHAMAAKRISQVTNYHPREGGAKVNAAFGYAGVVDDQDHAEPRVWTRGRLVLASWIFAAGVTLWYFKRLWRTA